MFGLLSRDLISQTEIKIVETENGVFGFEINDRIK